MPFYEKAQSGVFDILLDQLEQAKFFAQATLAEAEKVGTDNPSTKVHLLVGDMQKLKQV